MPGVSSIRVVFVMGTAEFDLDTSILAVEEIVRTAQQSTGFKCIRTIRRTCKLLMSPIASQTSSGTTACTKQNLANRKVLDASAARKLPKNFTHCQVGAAKPG